MKFDVVRAWKDENYRQSLSEEQRNLLPANPAGESELTDTALQDAFGAGSFGFLPWEFGIGGFGHGSFNRVTISNSCSRNCSFGCDIRQDF